MAEQLAVTEEVKIENLTNWLQSLRLNSGTTLHLPPRYVSEPLPKVEVDANPEVKKLCQRQIIEVEYLSSPGKEPIQGPTGKAGSGEAKKKASAIASPKSPAQQNQPSSNKDQASDSQKEESTARRSNQSTEK